MKDTDLYSRILGLSDPWFVADVELDTAGGRVDVHVKQGDRLKGIQAILLAAPGLQNPLPVRRKTSNLSTAIFALDSLWSVCPG